MYRVLRLEFIDVKLSIIFVINPRLLVYAFIHNINRGCILFFTRV